MRRHVEPVNCVTRSSRSSVPVTSQSSDIQDNLDAFATARNVRMKQSATAPTSNVSGDHRSPGPSNSAGDAGLKHRQPFRRQFDIASDSSSPLDAISMWKRLHTCTPS